MEVGESTKQDLRVETDNLRVTVIVKKSKNVSSPVFAPLFSKLWDASETTAINVYTNPLMKWK